jgi:hypothetical protein
MAPHSVKTFLPVIADLRTGILKKIKFIFISFYANWSWNTVMIFLNQHIKLAFVDLKMYKHVA